jgi:adenine-specific DNA-methyltransferase
MERIRRAGRSILEGRCHDGWDKDVGFQVLKVDADNMACRDEDVGLRDVFA